MPIPIEYIYIHTHTFDAGAKAEAEATIVNTTNATDFIIFIYILLLLFEEMERDVVVVVARWRVVANDGGVVEDRRIAKLWYNLVQAPIPKVDLVVPVPTKLARTSFGRSVTHRRNRLD
jgi:hypothetical protein